MVFNSRCPLLIPWHLDYNYTVTVKAYAYIKRATRFPVGGCTRRGITKKENDHFITKNDIKLRNKTSRRLQRYLEAKVTVYKYATAS